MKFYPEALEMTIKNTMKLDSLVVISNTTKGGVRFLMKELANIVLWRKYTQNTLLSPSNQTPIPLYLLHKHRHQIHNVIHGVTIDIKEHYGLIRTKLPY